MKSAIYGAGSLGTILGAYLSRSGVQIDLISHNVSHINALRKDGAHVTGMVDFTVPVSALLPSEMGDGYDVIILMTKSIGNAETIRFLKDKLSPDGIICTCQNGLPESEIAEIIGEKSTFGCTIGWGATYLYPGCSELTSGENTFTFSLGRMSGGSDADLEKIRLLLSTMGKVEIEPDFLGARWSKLLINMSFSALSAVTGMTFGEVAANRKSRHIVQLLMKECVDVAHAKGIRLLPMQGKNIEFLADYDSRLKQKLCFLIIPFAMRKHRTLKSSMLQDIEKGRRTEIDAIDGAVVREGRKSGVRTPVTEQTVSIIHDIESGALKPSPDNLFLFSSK